MSRRTLLIVLSMVVALVFAFAVAQPFFGQAKQPKDSYILKGAPMGGVKFNHQAHSAVLKIACETCHHASKPEKPAAAPQQACSDCHTKPATPPTKTPWNLTFHVVTGQTGLCIDCHKKEAAAGKKPPTKCMECHKKENV